MKSVNTPVSFADSSEDVALTRSQVETLRQSFAKEGYFVLKNAVPAEKLAELHQHMVTAFDKAQQTGELFSGGGLMSGHLNCFPGEGSRTIYHALEKRGIIDLIKQIDPQATRLPNVGCNFNLPGSVTQHYHADREFTRAFTICNIAVVDTVVENGAMEMIPGTHRKFYPYWRFVLENPARNSIRVPMQRGDVMVRNSNVWHRGMPNRTAVARPMMALTWEDGGTLYEDPFAIEEGKIKFRPNWFKPTRLGRLRERLFVSVPLSYSAYRFVSSLGGKKGY
jgi:ectoine hydroxylase-related dioxygenase (phytanoyl-CoA dioxygenase family)